MEKEDLIQTIYHDVNNHLLCINGISYALKDSNPDHYKKIMAHTKSLEKCAHNIQLISGKAFDYKLQETPVADLYKELSQFCEMYSELYNNLVTDLVTLQGQSQILFNSHLFEQILLNIFGDAQKFNAKTIVIKSEVKKGSITFLFQDDGVRDPKSKTKMQFHHLTDRILTLNCEQLKVSYTHKSSRKGHSVAVQFNFSSI